MCFARLSAIWALPAVLSVALSAGGCSFTAFGTGVDVSSDAGVLQQLGTDAGFFPGQPGAVDSGGTTEPAQPTGGADAASTSDAQAPVSDLGWVYFSSGSTSYAMEAEFSHGPNVARTSTCATHTFGACQVWCPPGSYSNDWMNAGALEATLGSSSFSFSAASNEGNLYETSGSTDLWSLGAAMRVTAPGADFPPFSVSLAVPGSVLVTAPPIGATQSRSQDLQLSWSWQSGAGDLYVLVGNFGNVVDCTFPGVAGGSGSTSVPAAALSFLSAGSNDITIYVSTQTSTTVASGSVSVQATNLAEVAVGSGVGPYNSSINLE